MSRKPLIAGNWKMNLNHFEAIALVQKIAFSLPDKYFDKVDVSVLPPFTDLRSVQTLVDGDKLRLTYGAQDLSQHDSGAYTGEISGAFLAKLGLHLRRRRTLGAPHLSRTRTTRWSPRRPPRRSSTGSSRSSASASSSRSAKPATTSSTTSRCCAARWPGCPPNRSARRSSPTNRCGRSAPAGSPARRDAQEVCKAIRDELGKLATPAARGGDPGALRRIGERQERRRDRRPRRTSTARWSAARRWTASSSPRCRPSPPVVRCPELLQVREAIRT